MGEEHSSKFPLLKLCFALGEVTLDFLPKAPLKEIARWVRIALGFDHFHVCSFAPTKVLTTKKKRERGTVKVLVNIEN